MAGILLLTSIIGLLAPAMGGEKTTYCYIIGSRDLVENREKISNFPATPHAITTIRMKERGRRK